MSKSISDESYIRLLDIKRDDETIDELIHRLTKPSSLKKLIGIMTNKEVEELEKNIMIVKKSNENYLDKLKKDLV